jgi:hypothetical protein
VTVPHRPVQVRIWLMFFWCLLAIAFNHDQFQFIGNLLGGLKRLRCSKGPVKFGIGYGQKLGAPPLGFFLRSRNMPNPGFKSEVRRLRRGQDKILRHKLSTAFAQKKKSLVLVNSEILK